MKFLYVLLAIFLYVHIGGLNGIFEVIESDIEFLFFDAVG